MLCSTVGVQEDEEEVRKSVCVCRAAGAGGEGSFCENQQFSALLSQAKITFNSQGSLLPQILFSLSHCSTADSFGCPFIFFDSIKYIPQ